MLDDHEAQIRAWLEGEPALPAQAVLQRLIADVPDYYTEKHLQTVQRAVKLWRGEIARKLLRGGAQALTGGRMREVPAHQA